MNNIESDSESILSSENDNNDTLPWVEKYRPKNFDEIISNNDIINTLRNFLKISVNHMLFYGPSGTGKTSTIITCTKELFGDENTMILELNASDCRGVDIVRCKIKPFVKHRNISNKHINNFKLIILDEVDAMTTDAQIILRTIIDDNSDNARFCLICNNINKINSSLQSRCAKFRFSLLKKEDMNKKLKTICINEQIQYTNEGIDNIIKISNGDMRKAINLLQTSYLTFNNIESDNIFRISNHCSDKNANLIINILKKVMKDKSIQEAYNEINNIKIKYNIHLLFLIISIQKKNI